MKNPAAVDILIGLLPDEDVQGHAIAALRKLKPLKARPYLEPYTHHPNAWIRREASPTDSRQGCIDSRYPWVMVVWVSIFAGKKRDCSSEIGYFAYIFVT